MNERSPGLCASCHHARSILSASGSRFYQCLREKTDPSFPKWPPLPTLSCRGYEAGEGEEVV